MTAEPSFRTFLIISMEIKFQLQIETTCRGLFLKIMQWW